MDPCLEGDTRAVRITCALSYLIGDSGLVALCVTSLSNKLLNYKDITHN